MKGAESVGQQVGSHEREDEVTRAAGDRSTMHGGAMTTDDTARAILDYKSMWPIEQLAVAIWDGTEEDGNYGQLLCQEFPDLQAMAKLWLMLPEIEQFVANEVEHRQRVVMLCHRMNRADLIDNVFGRPDIVRMGKLLDRLKALTEGE